MPYSYQLCLDFLKIPFQVESILNKKSQVSGNHVLLICAVTIQMTKTARMICATNREDTSVVFADLIQTVSPKHWPSAYKYSGGFIRCSVVV